MFSRRLTFGARLTLLVVLLALPIVLLASILTADALADIRRIEAERQGAACLGRLWPAAASQDQAALAGAGRQPACAGLAGGVDSADASLALAPLFADVADRSQITLDRDIDTYYLGHVATVRIPGMLVVARGGGSGVGDLASAADGAFARALAAAPPRLRPQIAAARAGLAAAASRFQGSDHGPAAAQRLAGDLTPVWRGTATALDGALVLHIRMRWAQLGFNALLVGLLTSGAALIAFFIHASITRQTGALVDATQRLMQGDTTVAIPFLDDAHETGRLAHALEALRTVQAERADLLEESQSANRAKSEFLANMSHEVRTPLAAVIGFGELIEADSAASSSVRRFASRITAAGRTLLAIVNDVLDVSMLEAGRMRFDPQPFEPAAFLTETVDMVAVSAAERGLKLDVGVGGAMPHRLLGDAPRLRQVLLNLLSNAIKFTDAGGVDVTARHSDGMLRIEVADTGPGVPADALGLLFQRFSQADQSTTRRHGGSGLGLAICKGLIEGMGGRIGVDSTEGVGSTFWFETPAEAVAEPTPSAAADSGAHPGGRVLVVDDSDRNRELIGVILSAAGYEVAYAHNGAEAVERAGEGPYDLILMDMQMPVMDGPTATQLIRNHEGPNRGAPIVAISANVLPQHVAACLESGMDAHLAKPIAASQLLATVAEWLTRRSGP